ncbi:cytochrome, mitochondrial [Armadillidium vulgare]|nr:cytochrome, mitochondrial [Armadillidium vulgare]
MQTTVNHRFNCLDSNTSIDNEASQLLWASKASTKSILKTDNGIPFWKWFDTPLYKQLTKSQDIIYRIALKYIDEKEKQLQESIGKSAKSDVTISLTPLEYFLLHSDLSKNDVLTIVCDALLAGTDTVSKKFSFIIYIYTAIVISKPKLVR